MGDENIRRIIMEDCDDDESNLNEEKDIIVDTPEVLFSITKDKIVKQKKKNDEEDSPKSIGASGSAFKSFKRENVEPSTKKEDSKILGKNVFQNNPLSKKQVIESQIQHPIFNPLSSMIGGLNTNIPNQIPPLPLDPTSILLQAILGGSSTNQFNLPSTQNLNNTVLNLLMTLAWRTNITN